MLIWELKRKGYLLSGRVAQLGERRPYKANVGSSNLSTPTTYKSVAKQLMTIWSGSSVG